MLVHAEGPSGRRMRRCASWQGRKLLVDDRVFLRGGKMDEAALQTAKAICRCGAEVHILKAPDKGRETAERWAGNGTAKRYQLQDGKGLTLMPSLENPLLNVCGTAECAVVGRYSSEHMPHAQETGAVTVIASGDFPFWKVAIYLKALLYFGKGDFARGFDALKPSLLRQGMEYLCFRSDDSRVLYLG